MIQKIKDMKKINLLVMFLAFFQIVLGTYNLIVPSWVVNKCLFILNYVLLFSFIIVLVKDNMSRNFLMYSYYGCFFIFLMGQKLFLPPFNDFLTFTRTSLDVKEYSFFAMILALGIIIPYYSYNYFVGKRSGNCKSCKVPEKFIKVIRTGFYLTLPFALYMQLSIVLLKMDMSYTGGYLVNMDFPVFVKVLNYLFPFFALSLLALKPAKKEMGTTLFLYFMIEGGVQLLQGRRMMFAVSFLFIIWYLLKYFDVKKIEKKYIIFIGLIGFSIVILFYFVEMIRGGKSIGEVSIFKIIREFMISTGGSDSVIANTIHNHAKFPKSGIVYMIDPIIHNPITILLTGEGGIPQGLEYLEHFDSFSHWISYLTASKWYLKGYGMGSSYLAESFLAFGLVGVIFISLILGKLIAVFTNMKWDDCFFKIVSCLFFVTLLFSYPRSGAFEWFAKFTYILVGMSIVWPIYYFLKRKENEQSE